jgi:hypothetical protein
MGRPDIPCHLGRYSSIMDPDISCHLGRYSSIMDPLVIALSFKTNYILLKKEIVDTSNVF